MAFARAGKPLPNRTLGWFKRLPAPNTLCFRQRLDPAELTRNGDLFKTKRKSIAARYPRSRLHELRVVVVGEPRHELARASGGDGHHACGDYLYRAVREIGFVLAVQIMTLAARQIA